MGILSWLQGKKVGYLDLYVEGCKVATIKVVYKLEDNVYAKITSFYIVDSYFTHTYLNSMFDIIGSLVPVYKIYD